MLKYLSRYTHRVAISNRRLLFVGNAVVRFAYRDYGDHRRSKQMTLRAGEFLRRFLLHVVPRGFTRIRHYGILTNCQRGHKLARCREILGVAAPPSPRADLEGIATPHPDDGHPSPEPASTRCPLCGQAMRVIEILGPPRRDTS